MSKFKRLIISILHGVFLVGYNIGTGSITAISKAGASFGTALLWTIIANSILMSVLGVKGLILDLQNVFL